MASLYIKDSETAALAAEVATMLNTTKTDAVRDALLRRKAEIEAGAPRLDLVAWLKEYRARNPLPAAAGLKMDKPFFDWLSGEEDVPEA